MSSTYETLPHEGVDTFEVISKRVYGTENYAQIIRESNPGVEEPIASGIVLLIPTLPERPKDVPQKGNSDNPDEVAIFIDGERYDKWTTAEISRSIDRFDTFTFNAPFDPTDIQFRLLFKPLTFAPVEITVGGERLFTGTLIRVDPTTTPAGRTVGVSGYSLPGVLNDCTPPASQFPKLEFSGQTLFDMAISLASPFGVGVGLLFMDELGDLGTPFDDPTAIKSGEKILSYLSDKGIEKGVVFSSDEEGNLIIQKEAPSGDPVASIAEGDGPLLSATGAFDPQKVYSHITAIPPSIVGGLGEDPVTVRNDRLLCPLRPLSFEFKDSDGDSKDITNAVQTKMGRMYASSVSVEISVSTWRDFGGNLWKPNTTINLEAPGAMVYSKYEFLIRSVKFSKSTAGKTATLNLVLPGSYSGKVPESYPWD